MLVAAVLLFDNCFSKVCPEKWIFATQMKKYVEVALWQKAEGLMLIREP